MNVTRADIREGAGRLGLSGKALCMHASLRSFGWVEGGAATVVGGLLAEGCIVLAPTFSWGFAVPPPEGDRPARNGWDYEAYPGPTAGLARVYKPGSNEVDRRDMGAISAAVVAWPGRVRGNNPLCSFSAVGPLAEELVSGQTPSDVFAPLREIVERDGLVVLMGVGLERATLTHLAEEMAGRDPFVRWANGADGRPLRVHTGGCAAWAGHHGLLRDLARQTTVGLSLWRALPARETLDAVIEAIREDPLVTHCGDPECLRCNDAVRGGPVLD